MGGDGKWVPNSKTVRDDEGDWKVKRNERVRGSKGEQTTSEWSAINTEYFSMKGLRRKEKKRPLKN